MKAASARAINRSMRGLTTPELVVVSVTCWPTIGARSDGKEIIRSVMSLRCVGVKGVPLTPACSKWWPVKTTHSWFEAWTVMDTSKIYLVPKSISMRPVSPFASR